MTPNPMTRGLRYTLMVVLLVGVLSPLLSLYAAQRSAERAVRTAQQTAVAQQERSRQQYCDLITALLNVYVENPPSTDTGKAVQKEYLVQYEIKSCKPPRIDK